MKKHLPISLRRFVNPLKQGQNNTKAAGIAQLLLKFRENGPRACRKNEKCALYGDVGALNVLK